MILPIDTTITYYFIYFSFLAIASSLITALYSSYYADINKRSDMDFKLRNILISIFVSGVAISGIAVVNNTKLNNLKEEAISKLEANIAKSQESLEKAKKDYEIANDNYALHKGSFENKTVIGLSSLINSLETTIKEDKTKIEYINNGRFVIYGDRLISRSTTAFN